MSEEANRAAVEAWFIRRGLPFVVRRRIRGGALLQRSTPALVVLVLLDPLVSALGVLLSASDEEFERRADNPAFVVALLAITLAALVVPVLAGWLVSRWMRVLPERGRLLLAVSAVTLAVLVLPVVEQLTGLRDGVWVYLGINLAPVIVVLLLVYAGAGSILVWALRNAVRQLGTIGMLASRALPLLMLVVLFSFFAAEVWQAAAALDRWRLWLVVAFLAGLAVLFLAAVLSDELREMASTIRSGGAEQLEEHLAATPLMGLVAEDHPTGTRPLTRAERVNVALVLFFSQALQIVMFAVLVFGLFMVFGALTVRQVVVESWLGDIDATKRGELFGVELPVSNALVQVSLFLAVFSGLYFAASVATDARYRRSFFEPLLADVRISLAAREVYLARWFVAS